MNSLAFNVVTTPDQESGLSCLQSACIEGDIETFATILNHSPDKLYSAIALRCNIGQRATNFAFKSIDVAVQLAAREGRLEHIQRLLDCGEYEDFETPLMLAARFKEEDVVEFLVGRGAALDLKKLNLFKAIHFAADQEKTRNALRFIELRASVSKGNDYTSPLHGEDSEKKRK